MEKDTRNTIIAVVAAAALFVTAYAGLLLYSGTNAPFYTVESRSMSHSERSEIGIIDTGDMVIVRDPSKMNIVTYVEGHQTGYKKFGDHGDVILYKNPDGRTIIHRAVLYIELNDDGITWNIPSLKGYGGEWYYNDIPGGEVDDATFGEMSGKLRFEDFGWAGKKFTADLDKLTSVPKGYITMGDGRTNPDIDQNYSSISMNRIVSEDRIIAVAAHEVPWLGCIKLYLTGNNTDQIPSNSVISLVAVFVLMIASILIVCKTATVIKSRRK